MGRADAAMNSQMPAVPKVTRNASRHVRSQLRVSAVGRKRTFFPSDPQVHLAELRGRLW